MIDNVENFKTINKLKIIFDYFKIIKNLPRIYIQLTKSYYNYLFKFRHSCYIIVDLKYSYLLIPVDLKDCKLFTFIILIIGQF